MKNEDKLCQLSSKFKKKISFNIFMTLSDLLDLKAQKSEKVFFFKNYFAFIKFIVYLQS